MLKSLSYRHITAHFLPGIVMLIAIILICDVISCFTISTYIDSNPKNLLVLGIIFVIGSITMGLIVDGIRYGIEEIIKPGKKDNIYAGVNHTNFEDFKYIYENAYPFYQLYSNMCVSLSVLAFSLPLYLKKIIDQKYTYIWWVSLIIIVLILLMHILAAKRALQKYEEAMVKFFRKED